MRTYLLLGTALALVVSTAAAAGFDITNADRAASGNSSVDACTDGLLVDLVPGDYDVEVGDWPVASVRVAQAESEARPAASLTDLCPDAQVVVALDGVDGLLAETGAVAVDGDVLSIDVPDGVWSGAVTTATVLVRATADPSPVPSPSSSPSPGPSPSPSPSPTPSPSPLSALLDYIDAVDASLARTRVAQTSLARAYDDAAANLEAARSEYTQARQAMGQRGLTREQLAQNQTTFRAAYGRLVRANDLRQRLAASVKQAAAAANEISKIRADVRQIFAVAERRANLNPGLDLSNFETGMARAAGEASRLADHAERLVRRP